MTLLNIITAVKERFPNTNADEIGNAVSGLEQRIINEIFSPHGIEVPTKSNDSENNELTSLILGDENILLYIYYLFSIFSLKEMDVEAANAYSTAFNEKFAELSAFYRRKHPPIKKIKLSGGV